ncbi:MAG: ABC transporter substrate-binding protein [Acidisphaera sp.]|nr:ABC transporter substrate-binding protein [Acidisphaera sp.]
MIHLHPTRRGVLAAGAAATMLPWAARAQTAAPKRGGTLRISVDQAVGVLNPLLTRVNPEYLVAELLYSGLTRLAPDMSAEPDLAQSWAGNAELTEWIFKLRPGVTFHDGSACTAKDVVASFTAILDPKTASPGRNNVGPVAQVTAVDDTTVRFTLKAAFADLPVTLAYTNAKIVPAALVASGLERLSRSAVGTGPFKLVSYEPDRQVVVARNDAFYDPARPYVDRVEVVVYPDATAEASALISGDTDLMSAAAASEFARLSSSDGVTALRVPSGQFLNINMGCDKKPFSDVRLRQALALTVDREAMVGFVAQGYGTPGNDTPINPAYRFYEALPLRPAQIAQAKTLLAQAGFPDGIDLTLVASDTPATRTQLGIAVREMAKPAGFRIDVQTMPHATYLDQVWKKGSFYVGFYNMQATADAIFSLLYTSDAAWNETRWNFPEFDRLVDEARVTTDEAKRRTLYGQAQTLMHDQVPSVIPVFFDLLAAQRSYVQGYKLHPRGAVFRLDWVWLGTGAPKRS